MKLGTDPVSTITWVDSIDEKLLVERVKKMVGVNPWLAGRFVKRTGDDTAAAASAIEMGYNSKPTDEDVAELIQVVGGEPELGRYGYEGGASYSKLMKLVESHLLKAGQDLKQQPMWKLTIVKPSVLVVSMTHGLGDGSSYYTLFNMLISGKIEKVQIERVFGLPGKKEKVMGGYEEAHLNDNCGMIFCFVRGIITSLLIAPWVPFVHKATARFFLVKTDVIKDMKQKISTDVVQVPYISTNDIITSWFFKNANLGHYFMAANLRGRMDELPHHNMVGNYEELLYYRTPDIETPELIRKSLFLMKRAVTGDQPIKATELALSRAAVISNWSTFCNLGAAVGFKVVGHAPTSEIEKSVPSTTAVAIVFEARPGQLGVMLMGTPSKLAGLQAAAPFEDTEGEPFLVV